MDTVDEAKRLRDAYEVALDQAESRRSAYHQSVRKLYMGGMPLREIADQLGISHQRVHQIVGEEPPSRRRKRRAAAAGGAAILVLVTGAAAFLLREPGRPAVADGKPMCVWMTRDGTLVMSVDGHPVAVRGPGQGRRYSIAPGEELPTAPGATCPPLVEDYRTQRALKR